jgi:hypothetical protein
MIFSAQRHVSGLKPMHCGESEYLHRNTKKGINDGGNRVNTYVIEYQIPHSGAGIVRESVDSASEQNARDLIRAKFAGQEVQILSGRQIRFGGGRDDDRRDRGR